MFLIRNLLCLAISFFITISIAAKPISQIEIKMHITAKKGVSKYIGYVDAKQTKCGVLFTPHLFDLPPGVHGFHVHAKPNCSNYGMAAGPHYDPMKTDKHLGPYNNRGHLGDLPVLIVNPNGTATLPMLAPKLKLSDLKGHALMIHANGDNYSDKPKKNGGGGRRIACGVIS